jgi:hypothetical protein
MTWMLVIVISLLCIWEYHESKIDPYEIGIHINYSIICENGFVYKNIHQQGGTIQVFNSDGTPLKCGEAIY